MSHSLSGIAEFVFQGIGYLLKLDNRIYYYAEEVLGSSVIDAIEQMRADLKAGKNPMLKTVVAMLYGGLKENHPDMTENLAIDMIMSGDPQVREALLKAMRGAQTPDIAPPPAPKGQAGNARKGKKPSRAGTGS